MSNSRGKHKSRNRARTKKVSKGLNRERRHPLDEIQKATLGKGRVRALVPVVVKAPWRGVRDLNGSAPYDAAQVQENKRLYPHLFTDQ